MYAHSYDCYAFEITDAIENLEFIRRRIEKYDAQINLLVDELCTNLLTVPGIGYTTAELIAGEIGDAERFHSAESLISYSGIDVTVYESGKYKAKYMMPSKKGSRYLRYALFQVARVVRLRDPVFNAYNVSQVKFICFFINGLFDLINTVKTVKYRLRGTTEFVCDRTGIYPVRTIDPCDIKSSINDHFPCYFAFGGVLKPPFYL